MAYELGLHLPPERPLPLDQTAAREIIVSRASVDLCLTTSYNGSRARSAEMSGLVAE